MAVQSDPIREWRERYARSCLNVDFEPLAGAPFHASLIPTFPELRLVRAELSPGSVFRDDELLRDGNDGLEIIVAQSPELNVTHQGHEIRLAPGDATMMQASATGRVGSRESFGFMEAVISSAGWEARAARPEDGFTASFDTRSIIRRHIVDLAVLAATTRCSIGDSSASAVVATRLAAALDYIASHF